MSTPTLVTAFYERIWNSDDSEAVFDLLTEEFSFRGSLGTEIRGREAFQDYVRSIREALANYHCEILRCVAEGDTAFARMRFSGLHVAPLIRSHGQAGPLGRRCIFPIPKRSHCRSVGFRRSRRSRCASQRESSESRCHVT
jgi:hypothetical protein